MNHKKATYAVVQERDYVNPTNGANNVNPSPRFQYSVNFAQVDLTSLCRSEACRDEAIEAAFVDDDVEACITKWQPSWVVTPTSCNAARVPSGISLQQAAIISAK